MKPFAAISTSWLVLLAKITLVTSSPTTQLAAIATTYSVQQCSCLQLRTLTTAMPSMEVARNVSRTLVQRKLAGLVNIIQDNTSIYEWDGEIFEGNEILLMIYTLEDRISDIEHFLRSQNIYEEPGLIAMPINGGSPSFLRWLEEQSNGSKTIK